MEFDWIINFLYCVYAILVEEYYCSPKDKNEPSMKYGTITNPKKIFPLE